MINYEKNMFKKGDIYLNELCKKYLICITENLGKARKIAVVISHTDLDGITSAINLTLAHIIMGWDVMVFGERTSTALYTAEIAEFILNNKLQDKYDEVEIIISDRCFLPLDDERLKNIPENVKFSWYDHHEGNEISKEDIIKSYGENFLVDYHCEYSIHNCGATLTAEAMSRKLDRNWYDSVAYEDAVSEFSRNVCLWDTFKWKKEFKPGSYEYELGKKMGTIDKVVTDENELFDILSNILSNESTLNSEVTYNWIDNCNKQYQDMLQPEFEKAVNKMVKLELNGARVVLLPTEWKFSSNIKEKYSSEVEDAEIVICYSTGGGTVYTSYSYDIPAYTMADFIGKKYGYSGGGHPNAAGFRCYDFNDYPEDWSEDQKLDLIKDRVQTAITEFMNK